MVTIKLVVPESMVDRVIMAASVACGAGSGLDNFEYLKTMPDVMESLLRDADGDPNLEMVLAMAGCSIKYMTDQLLATLPGEIVDAAEKRYATAARKFDEFVERDDVSDDEIHALVDELFGIARGEQNDEQ